MYSNSDLYSIRTKTENKKKKNRLMLCFQGVEFVFKDIQTSLEGVEPYQATSILGSRM